MKIIQRLINPAIQSMQAYHVPPSSGLIKLDAMENPYTWPEELKKQWLEELETVSINRYPDPAAVALREKIRSVMGISEELSIMLGNGSDELIQIIAMALAQPDRVYMAPEPGFVMYRLISQTVNAHFKPIPLNSDDFSLEMEPVLTAMNHEQPVLIFIAYPNNPTGNLFDENVVLEIIRKAPGLVVIDEAYHAFAGKSFVRYIDKFENLLVMRTLSKSGLAGLRLGYMIGSKDWLQELDKIRLPYNINSLTQKTADFILTHYQILQQQAQQICKSREVLFNVLHGIDGIKVWPSEANFILFRVVSKNSNEIYAELKQQGILIKNMHGSHAMLENCLRVTIGTDDENALFLETLKRFL